MIMSLETFRHELEQLCQQFEEGFDEYQKADYSEAKLREDFLNPFFEALGWDLRNKARLIQSKREVEVESVTRIGSNKKRADYLFRLNARDRFVCEAKKPRSTLAKGPIFQAKRYAWNKDVPLAILSDFEEFKIFIVGSRPDSESPDVGNYKTVHFKEYLKEAEFLWNLLSREKVLDDSIDRLIDDLPKRAPSKKKMRQGYLIRPDRTRTLDVDFLNFLDEAREQLASSLLAHNDRDFMLEHGRINEATQKILDRLLFIRICEDREIDTGPKLETISGLWESKLKSGAPVRKSLLKEESPRYGKSAPQDSLYRRIVRHFRELDRRPPGLAPFFNGNLFKPHFSEELEVGDEFLFNFLEDLAEENSPYLFNAIPVEILGTIYERFLGKVVVPKGRGIKVEEKPEVRKAGGVYYTPRYIVNYIVEQTVGKLVEGKEPQKTLKFRILDPACGSGSFLIRAFERMCEHWQEFMLKELPPESEKKERAAWQKKNRNHCWLDDATGDVHLSVDLKRRILTENIYGVDLDAAAVEVTQLSLYLKMLENENRTTLDRERELFPEEVALLPPLENNIKCGNSLIASDFSMIPEDLVRVNAFDWNVGFASIMKAGGFDAVVGNPPYVRPHNLEPEAKSYYWKHYNTFEKKGDLYCCFVQKASSLCRANGRFSFIVSNGWLRLDSFRQLRNLFLDHTVIEKIIDLPGNVFTDASVKTCIFVCIKASEPNIDKNSSIEVWSQVACGDSLSLKLIRNIPQETFRKTYKEVFDISISPETEYVKDRVKSNGRPLGEMFDICFGLKSGDDSKYLHINKEKVEDRPLLRGENIGRYHFEYKNEYVWYVPDQMRRHRITARPGEPSRFEQPKILIKDTTSIFAGTYDEGNYYVKDVLVIIPFKNTTTVNLSLKAVLGMLNSRLLTFFYRTTFQTIHVQRSELASLPIADVDLSSPTEKAQHDKLVNLVDKMLVLMPKLREAKSDAEKATLQNAVTATDQQIDQIVYELYGLTEEEIKLVENSR